MYRIFHLLYSFLPRICFLHVIYLSSQQGLSVYLQAATTIDPATGWVEIRAVSSAHADLVANQVELVAWLARYHVPSKVIIDRGREFFAEFKTMMQDDYNITIRPITPRNPQANDILERVHQAIRNILRTFKVQNMVLDDVNSWDGILATTMFALHATVHTPAQLVFGRDSLINISHKANGQLIKAHK